MQYKGWYLLWFCLDVSIVNAYILMQITQLQFHIEVVKMMISNFLSHQHAIQEGTVQTGHWPIKMSKGRRKRCLKRKKTTFCHMGCDTGGKRFCLDWFKNHNTEP